MPRLALALVAAVVPGVYRAWIGRGFRDAATDPAIAERWWTARTRTSQVTFVAAAAAAAIQPRALPLTLPVLILALTVGGFPARRIVFGENWSLVTYLWWALRLIAGLWGFWLLLAFAPWVPPDRSVAWAAAVAIVLVAWQRWYGSLLRVALGARPLDPSAVSPELAEGFARVLGRSTARPPALWRAGPPESTLANAVALPAFRRSSVLFSNALLETLTPREATAILAHEIGHIEYFTRRRQLVMSGITVLLIATATLGVTLAPGGSTWLLVLWPVMLIGALVARARWQQKHEADSDRRAVELCGDGQALASGLIKLHEMGRVPRRWAAAVEAQASHPSLARRLAAIDALEGRAPAVPSGTLAIEGTDGRTWITIGPDRVRHLTGVPAGTPADPAALAAAAETAFSIPYSDVREIRVVASRTGASLRIWPARGAIRSCPLKSEDVGRVQAALDGIDHLIPSIDRRAAHATTAARALGLSLALAGVLLLTPSVAALGLLAAAMATPAATLAAGLGAAAAAIGAIAGAPWLRGDVMGLMAVGVFAATLIWVSWRQPPREMSRGWIVPAALAAATIAVWATGVFLALSPLVLHRLAALSVAATALPVALGGALWRGSTPRRRAAAAVWLLALVPAAVGSPPFVRLVLHDDLLGPLDELHESVLALEPMHEGPAPHGAFDIRVSADGRRFITAIDESGDGDPSGRVAIGEVGHRAEIIEALDAAFLDEDHVLIVRGDTAATTLTLAPVLDVDTAIWRETLHVPKAPAIYVDARSRRWRVVGNGRSAFERVDGGAVPPAGTTRWTASGREVAYDWLSGDGGPLLGVGARYPEWSRRATFVSSLGLAVPLYPTALYVADPDGVRRIAETDQDVDCYQPAPGQALVCVAYDGASTRLWRFDAGELHAVGTVTGRLLVQSVTAAGEVAAWRAGGDRLLIDVVRREVFKLPRPANEYWAEWTSAGDTVAALVERERSSTIRTFRRLSRDQPSG
jgi:Zn-dependent protease with chaperone function